MIVIAMGLSAAASAPIVEGHYLPLYYYYYYHHYPYHHHHRYHGH